MHQCIEANNHSICLPKNQNMATGLSCHPSFHLRAIKKYDNAGCTPLPAHLPSILVVTPTPTPNPTPTPSAAATSTLHCDTETLEGAPGEEFLDDKEELMDQYHTEVPPLLPGTASRQALRAENMML